MLIPWLCSRCSKYPPSEKILDSFGIIVYLGRDDAVQKRRNGDIYGGIYPIDADLCRQGTQPVHVELV